MIRRSDRDLHRYFDGELSPRDASRVRAHLEEHPEDRARLESLQTLRAMLREAHKAAVEDATFDHLWTRIEAGIEADDEETSPVGFWAWVRRYALVAVPLAVVAGVLLLVWLIPVRETPVRNDCVIESLEVGPGTVGTIFTIDDSEETGETTVIWVTAKEDIEDEEEGDPEGET
jgi:hypothetical protein